MADENMIEICRREAQTWIDAGIGDGWPLTQAADFIEAQQTEIERLRTERDEIDALHQPDTEYYSPRGRQMCLGCDLEWPCPTYELLHPKKDRHV